MGGFPPVAYMDVGSIQGKLRKTEGGKRYRNSRKNKNVHCSFIKHDKLVM